MTRKVSSVVRQEVPEGEEPQDLPEPRGLQGVSRRPVPIGSLTTQMRRFWTASFRELQERFFDRAAATGAFERIAEDAAGGSKQGPVGRGGHPLGEERRRILRRVFERDGMRYLSDLYEELFGEWSLEVQAKLDPLYVSAFNAGGRGASRKLGVRAVFDLRNPFILDSLQERANLLTGGIGDDVFGRMKTVIGEGFYLEGQNPTEVAGMLRDEFSFLKKSRSELIARTETLAVTSEAQQTVFLASGIRHKRWLTTLDGRERETHFEAHGQLVEIDEPFVVGGAELQYPGDPSGPIEELANCRCDHIPVVDAGQQFEGSDVWRGDVAPDEFARDRRETAA